jgi:hypothetical protein
MAVKCPLPNSIHDPTCFLSKTLGNAILFGLPFLQHSLSYYVNHIVVLEMRSMHNLSPTFSDFAISWVTAH